MFPVSTSIATNELALFSIGLLLPISALRALASRRLVRSAARRKPAAPTALARGAAPEEWTRAAGPDATGSCAQRRAPHAGCGGAYGPSAATRLDERSKPSRAGPLGVADAPTAAERLVELDVRSEPVSPNLRQSLLDRVEMLLGFVRLLVS